MNEEQISKDLIEYLTHNISRDLLPADPPLNFPLLDSGAVDSLEIFKLIAHLEDTFGVQIKPEEIIPESFATIQTITKMVQGHLS